MAEIIDLRDIRRARARRREHELTVRCIAIMEESVAICREVYAGAGAHDRVVLAGKVRQLEELIDYASTLV